MPRFRLFFCFVIVLSTLSWSHPFLVGCADQPQADSVDRDYSRELPRIPAKEPQDALKTFTVAPGFRVEQVAAEPLVVDPIAMAFDESGRLFVVEMIGYSENEKDNLGQIRLLVDSDEDGRFDKSTVYAKGLSWPTAVTCYDGGIFVGAAPNIYFFKDTDGDGRADVSKVVFTGFGRSNVQGLLNTFKWGLDNRIHGATSSSGAEVRVGGRERRGEGEGGSERETESESPHFPLASSPPLKLRGRDFAFDPRAMKIEATSGGGQHGLTFDPWGNKFVCSNSNHIQFVMFDDRYLARNPYLSAPSSRMSIAADGPQADVFRSSPIEPWRIVRTRLRVKGLVPGPVEGGGTPAGYFTGATGVTIYRGDAWPDEYYGWAIVGDVGSNLIHRKQLEPKGVGFVARRVDEKKEFVTSNDIWFRPAQFANAPDGSLYVADMYREVIEHPKSLAPVIKKHLDLTSGRDRGRIYRIVPDGFKQRKLPRLGGAKTEMLVATLGHKNGWHRETAARLLHERQDRRAIPLLEEHASGGSLPEGRIRAMYALDSQSALSADVILPRLADTNPRVREYAVRLSEKVANKSVAVRERLFELVNDSDLRVRYQLAFTLGQLSGPQRNRALAQLMLRNASDKWMRLAVRSSLAEGSGLVLSILAKNKAGREVVREFATQIGRQRRPDDVAAVINVLRSLANSQEEMAQAIVAGLAAKQGSTLQKQIAAATGGRADQLTKQLVNAALQRAVNPKLKASDRTASIHQLQLGTFDELATTFDKLLEPKQTAEIQSAALDTMANFQSKQVAEILVQRWSQFTPAIRRQAGDVLFSREPWTERLLRGIKQKQVKLSDLDPSRLKLFLSHPNHSIRDLATAAGLNTPAVSPRGDVVRDYQNVLTMSGDRARGRAAFKKICAACHRLEGEGYEIGPNLAAMRNRGPEAVLTNVFDPNREVNPQYLSYVVVTNDGRTLTGMIDAETATSITLRRADNKSDTVLRIDIDEMRSMGQSLMPEGMEKDIDKQTMADLLEYLKSVE